jgi:hypothetical protein
MIRYNQIRNEYYKITYIKRNNSWLELSEKTTKPEPFFGRRKKKDEEEICVCEKCHMIKATYNDACGCD